MRKRLSTIQELEAWDQYFVAALAAVAGPGELQGKRDSTVQDFLSLAAGIADQMMSERSDRGPKKV
ncbi:hypothetical protein BK635_13095 [Pseudomonas chlororaphis]|nr:hypothetical protein BK635_13095 [Pseudomonas chlororaphis]